MEEKEDSSTLPLNKSRQARARCDKKGLMMNRRTQQRARRTATINTGHTHTHTGKAPVRRARIAIKSHLIVRPSAPGQKKRGRRTMPRRQEENICTGKRKLKAFSRSTPRLFSVFLLPSKGDVVTVPCFTTTPFWEETVEEETKKMHEKARRNWS